jgi:hypothetical protein
VLEPFDNFVDNTRSETSNLAHSTEGHLWLVIIVGYTEAQVYNLLQLLPGERSAHLSDLEISHFCEKLQAKDFQYSHTSNASRFYAKMSMIKASRINL